MSIESSYKANATHTLLKTMAAIRDKKTGCAWSQAQTWQSLFSFTLEEVHEVGAAIDANSHDGIKEELGDLLYQIVFYAEIAKEQGLFDFNEIANTVNEKLLRRHPHVFSGKVYATEIEHQQDWETIKQQERYDKQTIKQKSYFADISQSQPALIRSVKLKQRASQFGFDWHTWQPVVEKVREELDEVIEAVEMQQGKQRVEEEMGDLLMSVANLANQLNVEPENALRKANNKFEKRVNRLREILALHDDDSGDRNEETLDRAWRQAKQEEVDSL